MKSVSSKINGMKAGRRGTVFLLSLLSGFGLSIASAAPVGTAFTYSGRLTYKGNPANGNFDLQFNLFDASSGGNPVGSPVNANGVSIANGVLITSLDLGSGVFNGTAYWLEIAARPSGGANFTILSPRQPVNPAPYALFALSASGGGGNSSGWSLTGNGGTTAGANFLGTTDNQPLELKVNNHRVLRLEPAFSLVTGSSVNTLGGLSINGVLNSAIGATIAGGGLGTANGDFPNEVRASFGTIGGGWGNSVSGPFGTIPGGSDNQANGVGSFAAGNDARALHDGSFVWCDGTRAASSTGPNRFEVFASGGMTLTSARGISLDAADRPIITRGWDPFNNTAGDKAGLGRWGLFMEFTQLVLGMPDVDVPDQARSIALAKYHQDGSYDTLMTIQNTDGAAWFAGNVSVPTLTIRGGCDLAEPFQLTQSNIPAGSVVIVDEDHPGRLKLSAEPYDTRVAGVVSGANGISPGISLQQKGINDDGRNIALSGRVYAWADASTGAIRPGDLLTSSSTPGHAMKVTDRARAQGAVLGKAMSSLPTGKGLVLVLVTLQ